MRLPKLFLIIMLLGIGANSFADDAVTVKLALPGISDGVDYKTVAQDYTLKVAINGNDVEGNADFKGNSVEIAGVVSGAKITVCLIPNDPVNKKTKVTTVPISSTSSFSELLNGGGFDNSIAPPVIWSSAACTIQ